MRLALGMVAFVIAGTILRPVQTRLGSAGIVGTVLWFVLVLILAYAVLSVLEWVIGGVPARARRRRTRSMR